MTTLKQLNELAVAQENGATLEAYGSMTCEWHPIGKLDELDLDLLGDIRIQQPEIDRTDIEWCGYGVPIKSKCDMFMGLDGYIYSLPEYVDNNVNSGCRHLYRRKKPQVVPYTLETFELKSSHLFCISSKWHIPLGKNTDAGVYIDGDFWTYEDALCALWQWPDGTPFGVEVN